MADMLKQPRIKVAATVKNLDTNEFFIRIVFRSIDENSKNLTVPRADSRLPTRILAALDNAGALLPQEKDSALALVKDALAKTPTVQEFTTRRVGWCGKSFVLPDQTIGEQKGTLFFRSDHLDLPARKGKLRNYWGGLREPCAASPYLLFSIAVIFAGPLLALINRGEGAMFNFVGESSSGKTLCCRAAQSVLKGAGSLDLTAASLTPRGLEETAFASNDCGLIVDDLGKMKGSLADRAQTIREWAYSLVDGQGTVRSTVVAVELPTLRWRVNGLTSSEVMLSGFGRVRDRGETLRFIDIPVPAVEKFGVFAGAEDQAAANALAKAVEDTIAANHGLAFPAYLQELVPRADELVDQATRYIENFLARACPGGDAFEQRLAGKFAIVFAAAKIAAQLELAPWTASQAAKAVMQIYRIARSSLDMPDPAYRDFLGKINRGMAKGRFPRVEEKQSFPGGAEEPWGICRTHRGTGEIIAVFADTFDELCGSPMRRQRILEELQKAGILWSPQSNTPKAQLMVSGLEASRKRFYCLRQGSLKSALRAEQ